MTVERVPGTEDVYVVDSELLGVPGAMSLYLVDAERPALVDCGPATATGHVLDALDEVGVDPADVAHVVPTHVHLDHAGAAGDLAAACPNATVRVHERGRPYLVDPDRLGALAASARRALGDVADQYGDPSVVPPDRCEPLADGERVDLGDRWLEAIDAPGHAPHQHCLLDSRTGSLFAADAAGTWVADALYPTTPPPDFDLEASVDTVRRLRDRDPDRLLYGHFGPREDADAALAAYADLLPEWVDAVADLREDHDSVEGILANLDARWRGPTVERDVPGVLGYLDDRE